MNHSWTLEELIAMQAAVGGGVCFTTAAEQNNGVISLDQAIALNGLTSIEEQEAVIIPFPEPGARPWLRIGPNTKIFTNVQTGDSAAKLPPNGDEWDGATGGTSADRLTPAQDAEMVEWALWYAAHDIHVFPCDPKNKQPIGYLVPCDPKIGPDGKQVRDKNGRLVGIKGTGGVKKATIDPAVIREWWGRCPKAMIGAATGSISGFWAVDPDAPKQVKKGKPGELTPDGRVTWANLKAHYGAHAPTLETITPGGGNHIKFRFDPAHPLGNSEGNLPDLGINVRGTGGYVCIVLSKGRW